jgi:hypothetical protein
MISGNGIIFFVLPFSPFQNHGDGQIPAKEAQEED